MGGISKKAKLLFSLGRCPQGINRGIWVTFEGKYPRKGKKPWSFRKPTPVSDTACEMLHAAHVRYERKAET